MLAGFTDALGWFAVGGLLVLLGYLIREREWTFLIAGYDQSVDLPRDIAANVVGNVLLRIGIGAAVVGIIATGWEVTWLAPAYGALVIFEVLRMLYRLNTYDAPDPTDPSESR